MFESVFLRSVCKKHELMQYELEMASQDLAYKKQQKEELVTGVTEHLRHILCDSNTVFILLHESRDSAYKRHRPLQSKPYFKKQLLNILSLQLGFVFSLFSFCSELPVYELVLTVSWFLIFSYSLWKTANCVWTRFNIKFSSFVKCLCVF